MKVTAIVGSYHKGGVIDTAVDELLASAGEEGSETAKIYLIDSHIEFCTNCRECEQQEGNKRGKCRIVDEMDIILDEIERSDALILASPVNFGTVTAVMKKFIERLACYAYWPWGMNAPKLRNGQGDKLAVVVASSAAPSVIARPATSIVGLLKKSAKVLGAKTTGVLFIGFAAGRPGQGIGERNRRKARCLGKKLVSEYRKRAARKAN
jgi:multimeric flavodoxin WrbA